MSLKESPLIKNPKDRHHFSSLHFLTGVNNYLNFIVKMYIIGYIWSNIKNSDKSIRTIKDIEIIDNCRILKSRNYAIICLYV
jgi:hypothetical protein